MIKRILFIAICLVSCNVIMGQEDETPISGVLPSDIPLHNSIKYNRFVFNPTFSLVRENKNSINIYNRNPRASFSDNSQTYFMNYSARFEEKTGVGVGLFQQNVGIFRFFGAALNYAYNIELNRDMNFTFGMNLNYSQSGLKSNLDQAQADDDIVNNFQNSSVFLLHPGVNFNWENFDVGVSAGNLVAYNVSSSELITDNMILSGHVMYTTNLDWRADNEIRGMVYASKPGEEALRYGGNVIFELPQYGWGQVGYNSFYGAAIGIGANITKNVSIGYTVEPGIGGEAVIAEFGATHEFGLAYNFESDRRSSRKSGRKTSSQKAYEERDSEIRRLKREILEQNRIIRELQEQRGDAESQEQRAMSELERSIAEAKEKEAEAARQLELQREEEVKLLNKQAEEDRLAAQREIEREEAEQKAEEERLAAQREVEREVSTQETEEARIAAEEAEREAEAAKQQAEEDRLAAQREIEREDAEQKAEEERLAAQREVERVEAEQKAEEERLAAQREVERVEAEQKAEEERLAAQREIERVEAEQKAEEERLAAQREIERVEAEQKVEEERLAAQREIERVENEQEDKQAAEAEAARLAEEQRLAAEAEAARLAEEQRLAAEAEAARLAEEQRLAEEAEAARLAEEQRLAAEAEAARLAEEQRLAAEAEAARLAEEQRLAAEAEAARLAEEQRLAAEAEAARLAEEQRLAEEAEAARLAEEQRLAAEAEAARLAEEQRLAAEAEAARLAEEQRLAAEAEAARLAEEQRLAAEAEAARLAEEQRLAAEAAANVPEENEEGLEEIKKELDNNSRITNKIFARRDSLLTTSLNVDKRGFNKLLESLVNMDDDAKEAEANPSSSKRLSANNRFVKFADATRPEAQFATKYIPGYPEGYYLIGNVFKGGEYANKFTSTLKDLGFNNSQIILNPENNFQYVAIESYQDKDEAARKYLSNIDNRYYGDMWILHIAKSRMASFKRLLQETKLITDTVKDDTVLSESLSFIGGHNIENGYYLITNIFKRENYFERGMAKLKSQGLEPQFFRNPKDNYIYVYLKRFDNLDDAKQSLFSNVNNSYDGDLYILKIQ
ncbi:PorP/SprF family type IX secretion system membrane protein [Aquimarina sp. AD10]|uniref:PorP/SprF family type IX secretion system membrane protein n=1 Tax=Aquimarina sp. AD10 TaxID=1714849 RepID=UPI000EA9B4E0|nr:PorP/SprF family type IX secretion system membrane protein [Aquimarina sp. AD10]RKN02662.1 type IX secretion system membrane protein PorP/SprF [Aquimarina sp. AD10]